MAQIDYENTNGLEVLWHLLTTEPFFWFILSIGGIALLISLWVDRWDQDPDVKHYDETHHINR